jgi:hypothetical protein
MTKFLVLLPIFSAALTACGASQVSDGSETLTPRFNPGTFSLIECKDLQGKKTLSLEMVIHAEEITEIRVMQGQELFKSYDFVAARDRETDEGVVTEVELAKRQGLQMAFARWNLEQGILLIDRPNEELLDGTSCTISNKRVWETLSNKS